MRHGIIVEPKRFVNPGRPMLIRTCVYTHLVAIALTGLAAYLDRAGTPNSWLVLVYHIGIGCAMLLPVFPVCWGSQLLLHTVQSSQRLQVFAIGSLATADHVVAAIPLVQ